MVLEYDNKLKAALNAVIQAMALCEEVRNSVPKIAYIEKADHSPVTKADIGSQVVITYELLRVFGTAHIIAEEDVSSLSANENLLQEIYLQVRKRVDIQTTDDVLRLLEVGTASSSKKGSFWTIDPIDGTKGFLRGEQYAIALALIEDGEVVLGVLGCPNYPENFEEPSSSKGLVFYAAKKNGAYVQKKDGSNPCKINVDNVSKPSLARFCESVEIGHVSHDTHAQISNLLGITTPPLRIDSQCKYAAVARGDATIYLRQSSKAGYHENIWDHAAGAIIVTEAGGMVSDFSGYPLDFSTGRKLEKNSGILATNGTIHEQVLAAIKQLIG
ncbi:3'(2'),5'-bisphosphate nucleotidase [bacterium]|nr:3'(2'),5'-bisphosphate nucleotidase [bacterium]